MKYLSEAHMSHLPQEVLLPQHSLPLILQEPPASPASHSGGGLSLSPHKAASLGPQRQAHGCSRSEEWTVARHSHQRPGWWLNSTSLYQQFSRKIPVLRCHKAGLTRWIITAQVWLLLRSRSVDILPTQAAP